MSGFAGAGSESVSVLFVAGHGRSGSTLISRVLGQVPGFVVVGELRYLWQQGVRANRRCACGRRFRRCPFWRRVGRKAFGGWDQLDIDEVLELHRSIVRNRYVPFQLAPRLSKSFSARLDRYTALMRQLYGGIQAASGCDVIVDSSKFPSSAYLLRQVPDLRMRMVHLVRGSEAVCYSWSKHVARVDRGGRPMARHGTAQAALEWLGFNASLDGLRLLNVPTTALRYEDFVARPRVEVERVLDFCGTPRTPEELSFIGTDSVEVGKDHSVAGNPMRVRTGVLPLRLDDEWRTAMRPSTRRLVRVLTAPGLLRYGYLKPGRR